MNFKEWKEGLEENERNVLDSLKTSSDVLTIDAVIKVVKTSLADIDNFVHRHEEWSDEEWEQAKAVAEESLLKVSSACEARLGELAA